MAKGSGLNKKYETSVELEAVIGKTSCTRAQAVKGLWDYFKANGLNKGREITLDAPLKKIYGKSKISMFEVGGKKLSENLFDD